MPEFDHLISEVLPCFGAVAQTGPGEDYTSALLGTRFQPLMLGRPGNVDRLVLTRLAGPSK